MYRLQEWFVDCMVKWESLDKFLAFYLTSPCIGCGSFGFEMTEICGTRSISSSVLNLTLWKHFSHSGLVICFFPIPLIIAGAAIRSYLLTLLWQVQGLAVHFINVSKLWKNVARNLACFDPNFNLQGHILGTDGVAIKVPNAGKSQMLS